MLVSGLFILALAAILLLLQPFPMLHDYPEWMYQGHILHSLFSNSNPVLNGLFELVPVPVPNAISQIGIALLNYSVDPVMAGQIWLAVYFLLVALTAILACTRQRLSGAMLWIFVVTIAFGPGFWNGYINFQFALIFFALFIASGASQRMIWILLFSILIYFSHAAVFAGFVVYVVMREIGNQRRLMIVLALLPSMVFLVWYAAIRLLDEGGGNVGLESVSQWLQYKLYTLAKQGPFHNFIQPDGESFLAQMHGVYIAGFAINFLIAALIGLWAIFILWRLVRAKEVASRGESNAVIASVLILFVCWLLAGKNSFGVVNLGERFLIVALVLCILCVNCPRQIQLIWASLCAVASVGTLVFLIGMSRHAEDSYNVDRSGESTDLQSYVEDIYKNSRHKYFNHRLFIYASLGQYLSDPSGFENPPLFDHQSSIVRIRHSEKK